jgi:hypothetical protein
MCIACVLGFTIYSNLRALAWSYYQDTILIVHPLLAMDFN